MEELRRQYNELNPGIYLYPCILKRETFFLDDDLGSVEAIFFYPNEYEYQEYEHNEFPIIYFIHGGGWCFGGEDVDHKLPRELCNKTKSIVVYPLYSLSPEAKYPIAVKQCYKILCRVEENAHKYRIDFNSLVVGGDSAGGNLAITTSLLCKMKNGPKIKKQILINPVTDTNLNTNSYLEFQEGFHLTKQQMAWFFNQYLENENQKNEIFVAPNKATIEQLANLPETLFLVGEFDVLKDEGLEFCEKLKKANVKVNSIVFPGAIHDFIMYKFLNNTNCCKEGTATIIGFIC
ncbi:hypothetical protein DICPUDRAFT_30524 [Dictyostelium purpureum]|uniref:Alpha/beta hydrolase fold-3 domain-containing protein n=1 Tax=Dictyostelium purpureum TaxID=5786 RepID=F0ZFJ9_DICPU|nr:uncharacterized protein DICPUDRAFT_30524 [Dictyostelium purpureum]EGC37309.1 hypothetical protein DICPUDRAFT_30524 [Dictyostelium purpureum]|eukprot:XP_003286197.1 hypothetical protein DICPUDRAFT_30524 [Dictyostelium purpureum]